MPLVSAPLYWSCIERCASARVQGVVPVVATVLLSTLLVAFYSLELYGIDCTCLLFGLWFSHMARVTFTCVVVHNLMMVLMCRMASAFFILILRVSALEAPCCTG